MHLNGPDYPSWTYRDPERRRFNAGVAAACLVGLIVLVLIAAVCAAVNLAGVR
jgi:hypothetical protein